MNALASSLLSLLISFAVWADGWLGVYLSEAEQPTVDEVIPGSPAEKAGLKPGDRFLAVDDRNVATRDDFIGAVRGHKAGDKIRLKVQRDGREQQMVVTLAERPDEDEIPAPSGREERETAKPKPTPKTEGPAGAQPGAPAERPRQLAPRVRTKPAAPAGEPSAAAPVGGEPPYVGMRIVEAEGGLEVEQVIDGSPAAKSGIAVGDVVTKWGDREVRKLRELDELLRGCKAGDKVALQLSSGGGTKSVVVTLGSRPQGSGGQTAKAEPAQPPKPAKGEPAQPRARNRNAEPPVAQAPAPSSATTSERAFLGVMFGETEEGLVVQSVVPKGPADAAGIVAGDVLLAIGKDETADAEDLMAAMQKRKPGEKVKVRIQRDDETKTIEITLGRRPAEGAAASPTPAPGKSPVSAMVERTPHPAADSAKLPADFRHDYAAALEEANKSGRPLLVCYGANWNSGSQAQRGALSKAAADGMFAEVVCVAIDADKNGKLIEERGVDELPAFELLLDGKLVAKHTGYLPVEGLRKFVSLAQAKPKAKPDARPDAKPDARPDAKPQARPKADARPAPTKSTAELDKEIEGLRKDLQEVRRLLEELRKKEGGKEE